MWWDYHEYNTTGLLVNHLLSPTIWATSAADKTMVATPSIHQSKWIDRVAVYMELGFVA